MSTVQAVNQQRCNNCGLHFERSAPACPNCSWSPITRYWIHPFTIGVFFVMVATLCVVTEFVFTNAEYYSADGPSYFATLLLTPQYLTMEAIGGVAGIAAMRFLGVRGPNPSSIVIHDQKLHQRRKRNIWFFRVFIIGAFFVCAYYVYDLLYGYVNPLTITAQFTALAALSFAFTLLPVAENPR